VKGTEQDVGDVAGDIPCTPDEIFRTLHSVDDVFHFVQCTANPVRRTGKFFGDSL
jgi:hypothetical protein